MYSGASCLLVNMSEEAVHIQCVLASVETQQQSRLHQVTDFRRISEDDLQAAQRVRQGPLGSGDYLLLGRFENILDGPDSQQDSSSDQPESADGRADSALEPQDIRALELRAVAIHGPSRQPIGARRRFTIERNEGEIRIRPEGLQTEQLASRRSSAEVRRWLRDCLALTYSAGPS